MKDLKIKICGMKHPENIKDVASLEPDYLGFIFYKKSPRFFDAKISGIPNSIKRTGVFVDASVDFILEKTKTHQLQAIQLHGDETPEFCKELRIVLTGMDIEVIKVFSIANNFDYQLLEPYEGIVDYFLFDTKGKNKGGNGVTFNWEVLKSYPSTTPFFLSGGIGINETEEIQELINYFLNIGKSNLLYAIDVNSKFETEPGLKDVKALNDFIVKLSA